MTLQPNAFYYNLRRRVLVWPGGVERFADDRTAAAVVAGLIANLHRMETGRDYNFSNN